MTDGANAALTQLRAWLAQGALRDDNRLPPERELCTTLGVSRTELRKALQVLENEGRLWRQVGKGTFLGLRPAPEEASLSKIVSKSSPAEVMRARLKFEPLIAAEAALNATEADLGNLRRCIGSGREAQTWREYETFDNRFHRTMAEASGNTILTALFDHLNAIRRTVFWTRWRDGTGCPPADHPSFAEHDAIFDAVSGRDAEAAHRAMLSHLTFVDQRMQHAPKAAE